MLRGTKLLSVAVLAILATASLATSTFLKSPVSGTSHIFKDIGGVSNPAGFVESTLFLQNNTLWEGNVAPPTQQILPQDVVYNPFNNNLYVLSSYKSVIVIDGATNAVLRIINLQNGAFDAVADPANGNVFVTDLVSNKISVINGTTNTLESTIELSESPASIAYDSKNGLLYAALDNTNVILSNTTSTATSTTGGEIAIVNASTNMVLGTLHIPAQEQLSLGYLAYDPVNGYLYVTSCMSCDVSTGSNILALNVTSGAVVASVPTLLSGRLAVDTISGAVYVDGLNISVIDGSTNRVVSTINEGGDCCSEGIAFDPVNRNLYVTSYYSGSVSIGVIDTTTDSIIKSIAGDFAEAGLAVGLQSGNVYAPITTSDSLVLISGSQNVPLKTIPLDLAPTKLLFVPSTSLIYALIPNANIIEVINADNEIVTGNISLGPIGVPQDIAFDQQNDFLYETDSLSSEINVINITSRTMIGTVYLGDNPQQVLYDSDNENLYVSNNGYLNVLSVGSFNLPKLIANISINVRQMAFDPENNRIYTVGSGGPYNGLNIINGSTDTIDGGLSMRASAQGICYNTGDHRIYIGEGTVVSILDPFTNSILANITLPPSMLSFAPSGFSLFGSASDTSNGLVYLVDNSINSIFVLNASEKALFGNLTVGVTPWSIVYDSTNSAIFVSDSGSGTISTIGSGINHSFGARTNSSTSSTLTTSTRISSSETTISTISITLSSATGSSNSQSQKILVTLGIVAVTFIGLALAVTTILQLKKRNRLAR